MPPEQNTEQKILDAAEDIFQAKGYDGTRMQEIAEHAGINKGLLHYYFKTKDKLFEAIFSAALHGMVSKIAAILEMDTTLGEKISMIVDQYMALLLRNPHLPRFVINELSKNPDQFVAKHIGREERKAFAHFSRSVQEETARKGIRPIDARQLFINMMSLLVFPFIGRPMLQVVLGTENDEFKQLLAERKAHVKEFIFKAIRV